MAKRFSNDCRQPGDSASIRSAVSRAFQVVLVEIEEVADLTDGEPDWIETNGLDGVAGPDLALLQDAEIESGPPTFENATVEILDPDLDGELVAGHPRLGYLEQRRADSEDIADVDIPLQHPLDGEVLTEMTEREPRLPELVFPVGMVLEGVNQHGPERAAMPDEVGLAVAGDVESVDPHTLGDGLLEDAGSDGLALDRDLPGKRDVHRHELHTEPPETSAATGGDGVRQKWSAARTRASRAQLGVNGTPSCHRSKAQSLVVATRRGRGGRKLPRDEVPGVPRLAQGGC